MDRELNTCILSRLCTIPRYTANNFGRSGCTNSMGHPCNWNSWRPSSIFRPTAVWALVLVLVLAAMVGLDQAMVGLDQAVMAHH